MNNFLRILLPGGIAIRGHADTTNELKILLNTIRVAEAKTYLHGGIFCPIPALSNVDLIMYEHW